MIDKWPTGPSGKVNLMDLDHKAMKAFFTDMGEKAFRATQMVKWIHQHGVADFDSMTDMSKKLRAKLNDVAEIRLPEMIYEQKSDDGTRKWVLRLDSGNSVETVFIPEGDRGTLCVSSQVGCALECSFCSTAKQGFNRNLTVGEIIGQLWYAVTELGKDSDRYRVVTNVVMMGMGEPLLNYRNVVSAMSLMLDDNAYSISKRRVTLSTSGIVPALRRLKDDIDVALAVSLHAPNDALRDELVPINKKYPIEELLDACKHYIAGKNKAVVTWEYVMISGINDTIEHAEQLVNLVKNIPSKVNLIPFNPFPNSGYERSSNNRIHAFNKVLHNAGVRTTTRKTRGDDIDAACGQLVGKVQDKSRRVVKIQSADHQGAA